METAERFTLFTQPGWSSCLRAKEFLSKKGIDFVAVDVLNEPGGRERLLAYGVRNLPVVAKGDKYVIGQNLEDVAKFVGLAGTGHKPLPPDKLIEKWIIVLSAAQRYLQQLPRERLSSRVIENRDRSIRILGHHIFRIAEAYLETVVDGVDFGKDLANVPPKDGTFLDGPEFVAYGDEVIGRLQKWWGGLADRSCQQKLNTYFGTQPMHVLFERCTWHSAQHVRQLIHLLERFGIEPDRRLSPQDLAGLPLPERLFE